MFSSNTIKTIIVDLVKPYFPTTKQFVSLAIIFVLLFGTSYFVYHKYINPEVPLIRVSDTTKEEIKDGIGQTGHILSDAEVQAISNEIAARLKKDNPDSSQTFVGTNAQNEADAYGKEEGKTDGADVVITTPPKPSTPLTPTTGTTPSSGDSVTANYYGIHYEKNNAIGVYTDTDRDGSWGISIRHDRFTVAAGKKYKDGSLAVRATYDIIKK